MGREKTKNCCALVVLLLMIGASYSNIIHALPVLDDYHTFIQQPRLFINDFSVSQLTGISDTIFGWSRWIPMATFALNNSVGEGNLMWHHITNIAIHCMAMLATVFMVIQLLGVSREGKSLSNLIYPAFCAVWIAGVWALHPVQTNAVTYLVQRMASLLGLFYVLSISFYIKARRDHISRGSSLSAGIIGLYLLSLLCIVCAFLCKENAVTLPFMILMTELWFFRPELATTLWNRLKESRWHLRLAIVFIILAFLLIAALSVYRFCAPGYANRHFTMGERLLTEARVVVWYISLLLWPAPSRMTIEHDFDISRSLWNPVSTGPSLLVLIGMMYLVIRYRGRYPLLTYAGLWFFVNLAVESTVIGLELAFEHRLYLPSIGFFIFFVIVLIELFQRAYIGKGLPKDFVTLCWCCAALIVSVLSITTFIRNIAWESPLSIHLDSVAKSPMKARTHVNLAGMLYRMGRFDEAIQEAEKGIALGRRGYEHNIVAANTIVSSLIGMERFHEGVRRGEELFDRYSRNFNGASLPNLCLCIAVCYYELDQLENAYLWTVRAQEISLGYPYRAFHLMLVEWMQARILEATSSRSIDLDNDEYPDPGILHSKAWIARKYLEIGETGEAARLIEESMIEDNRNPSTGIIRDVLNRQIDLNRKQVDKWSFKDRYASNLFSRFNISMLIAYYVCEHDFRGRLKSVGEAFLDYALKLQPGDAGAHLLKGWYHFNRGQLNDAIACAQRAVHLDSQYARAWIGLGLFLAKAQKNEAALAAFETTLALYPGNPKRASIMGIIADLRKNQAS